MIFFDNLFCRYSLADPAQPRENQHHDHRALYWRGSEFHLREKP